MNPNLKIIKKNWAGSGRWVGEGANDFFSKNPNIFCFWRGGVGGG